MADYEHMTLDELEAALESGDPEAADFLRRAMPEVAETIDRILGREVGADRLSNTEAWRRLSARLNQRDPVLGCMADRIRRESVVRVIRDIQARMAETAPRGRPLGTGTFQSPAEFLAAMRAAAAEIRKSGGYPSQSRVLQYWAAHERGYITDERQLRRWCRQFGFKDWQDLLNSL